MKKNSKSKMVLLMSIMFFLNIGGFTLVLSEEQAELPEYSVGNFWNYDYTRIINNQPIRFSSVQTITDICNVESKQGETVECYQKETTLSGEYAIQNFVTSVDQNITVYISVENLFVIQENINQTTITRQDDEIVESLNDNYENEMQYNISYSLFPYVVGKTDVFQREIFQHGVSTLNNQTQIISGFQNYEVSFSIVEKDSITVEAGVFDVFVIDLKANSTNSYSIWQRLYYSPDVKSNVLGEQYHYYESEEVNHLIIELTDYSVEESSNNIPGYDLLLILTNMFMAIGSIYILKRKV